MVGIVECNCNRRVAERLSRLGSGENNILHISAAELLGALFAEHPAHRIANIALSTAVRPYNAGNTVVELQNGFVGKRLKSLHFNGFEIHNSPTLFSGKNCIVCRCLFCRFFRSALSGTERFLSDADLCPEALVVIRSLFF